jgi:hypothetical protein
VLKKGKNKNGIEKRNGVFNAGINVLINHARKLPLPL